MDQEGVEKRAVGQFERIDYQGKADPFGALGMTVGCSAVVGTATVPRASVTMEFLAVLIACSPTTDRP
jgi:hypothetical protein